MFSKLSLLLISGEPALALWLSRILALTMLVTGFFTYKGASLGATTFSEQANATVFAIGSAIAIYAFWTLVFKSMQDWETPEAKKKGLIIVAAGVLFILPLSSLYNASGIDRGQVLDHHQMLYINELSTTLDGLLAKNKALDGIIIESRQRETRYVQLRDDEGRTGSTSGVAGRNGAVYSALDGASKRFGMVADGIGGFQENAGKTLNRALVRLERIRAIASSSKSFSERDRLIKNEVDVLRADYAKLDGNAVKEAAVRAIASIPQEVRLAANYSQSAATKAAQAEALDRLSKELEDASENFRAALEDGLREDEDEIPLYYPISPTAGTLKYWPQVIPQLAGGAAIDLMPLALLFLCLVSMNSRSREENEMDALLHGTSAVDLLRVIALWDALKGDRECPERSQQIRDAALRDLKKD